ncbi:mucin-associated surface protein (MASP), putative, partial [Trypanosoma cruzi marinkellei]
LLPWVGVCVVRGVCCCRWWRLLLCRFFLLFCVDGELVCAEGCRQVRGVMAMMMTGHVLLVCALCVLWCGAGGGYALFMNSSDTLHYYGPNGTYCKNHPNVFSFCKSTTGNTHSEHPAEGTGPATQAQSGDSSSSSIKSHQALTPSVSSSGPNIPSENSKGNPGHTVTPNSAGGGGQSTVGNQSTLVGNLDSNHQTPNGGTGPNASLPESNDGQGIDSSSTSPPANQTEEPKVTEEGEGAPAALTTNDEPTGNSESENEQRSSENGVSAQPPEATEQGEGEDGNRTDKATDGATATKNATGTPGDSDGSIAVSHTTSPLLLFLLLVCAAAAAVVVAA